MSKVVSKVVANGKQSGSTKKQKNQETSSKVVAQPVAELVAKYEQSSSKVVAKSSFQELTGIQKKLTTIIYNSCRKKGEKISSPITIEYLSDVAKTSSGTVKNAILRLQKKNILTKEKFKNGRGGWTQYKLSDETYQDLLQCESDSKLVAKYEQTSSKVVAQPVAELVATVPSSSSSILINNKSTTTTHKNHYVTKWLESLDLSSLSNVGITVSTINRCLELYPDLEPEKIDDLICRFEEYLKGSEGKAVKNPRGFFISLAKQQSEGITPLDDIETPADRCLREYVRRKEEMEVQRGELEKKALDFGFTSWLEGLEAEERDRLVPPNNIMSSGSSSQTIMLKNHFENQIWPTKKEQIIRGDDE